MKLGTALRGIHEIPAWLLLEFVIGSLAGGLVVGLLFGWGMA